MAKLCKIAYVIIGFSYIAGESLPLISISHRHRLDVSRHTLRLHHYLPETHLRYNTTKARGCFLETPYPRRPFHSESEYKDIALSRFKDNYGSNIYAFRGLGRVSASPVPI